MSAHIGSKAKCSWFSIFARRIADWAGRPVTFALACGLIVGWAASGPLFGYSDTWQLVINTSTTIITFLMVFVIQNSQNREARRCR
jgi:low affinity Fe/Cu permease